MVTDVLPYTSDIDYEYPETPEQASGYVSLLSELRSALDAHAKKKGESNPYQLSVIQFAHFSNLMANGRLVVRLLFPLEPTTIKTFSSLK
jgi:hypothetical protein